MTFHFRNFAPRIASDTDGVSAACSPCFFQSALKPMKVQAACTMTFGDRTELDDWVLNLWPLDRPVKVGSSSESQYEIVCLWDQRTRLPLELWVMGRDADAPEVQGYSAKKTLLAGKRRGRGVRRSGRPNKRAFVERHFAKATAELVAGLDGNRPPRNEGNTNQARG